MADTDCAITEAPETPSEEPQPGSLTTTTNLESNCLDDDTKAKLKGDQIGDTMFKQSFVIKTLMKFKNIDEIERNWCEEFENDLCFLWDMTIEADVCRYLFELNYPQIAVDILQTEINHRLTEILIGILANICTPKSSPHLNQTHIDIILKHIDTNDHLILVQLMRFVEAIAYNMTSVDFINDEIIDKIVFILYNSINVSLLEATLDTVHKLTAEKKLQSDHLHENLLEASFAAFKVIYDSENDSDTAEPYKTDVVKRNINHLLKILVNLAVYCNEYTHERMVAIRRKVDEHQDVIFNEIIQVLKSYEDEYSITNDVGFIFESVDYIFSVFGLKCDKLTIVSLKMATLIQNGALSDVFDSFVNICKSFINALKTQEFDALMQCEDDLDKVVEGLNVFKNAETEQECEYDVNDKVDELIKIVEKCKAMKE